MQNLWARAQTKKKMTLGDVLVAEKVLTLEQFSELLVLQKHQQPFKPLGKMCVEMGYISQDDLARLIKAYKKRIVLGDLFINLGIATPAQVSEALVRQRQSGKKLGETLIDMCVITDDDLASALAKQLDIPLVKPQVDKIDQNLFFNVKKSFIRSNLCLPLAFREDAILVAMADPLREDLVKDLALLLGSKIEVVVASRYDIINALNEIYGAQKPKELPLKEVKRLPVISGVGLTLNRRTLALGLSAAFVIVLAFFGPRWYQELSQTRQPGQGTAPTVEAPTKKAEAPRVPSVKEKGETRPAPSPQRPLPAKEAEKPAVVAKEPPAQPTPAVPKQERKPAAPAQVVAPPQEPAVARFTIQVSSHPDKELAAKAVEQLKAKGLPAFMTVADLKEKGTWYRVKVGRYADSGAAKKAAEEVGKALSQKVIVTPL